MWLTCSGSQWGEPDHKGFTPVALLFCGHICRIHSAGASGCPEVLPGEGGLWTGQPQLHIPEGQLIFSSLRSKAENSVPQQVRWMSHTDPCPAWAFLGNPGAVAAVAAPTCPSQTTIASTAGLGKQTKTPLLCCSPRATNNGFLFPGSCRENHRYFFLFCSANISCKLKPTIFR